MPRRDRARLTYALPLFCLAALLVIDFAAIVGELRAFLNSDTAWILVMARRVLAGERLYVSTLEVNPPLIVWMHLPIGWLEQVSGIPEALLVRLACYSAIVASTLVCVRLLATMPGVPSRPAPGRLALVLVSVLLLLPMGAFTEREQLIALLLLPLGALTALRISGGRVRARTAVCIGVAAGLAIALKPQYLPCWLLLLALRRTSSQRFRVLTEDLALVAWGVVYIGLVAVVTPAFFRMAWLFGPAYAEFTARSRTVILLRSPETYWWLAAALAWCVRRPAGRDPVGRVLMVLCLGSLIAVLLQGKGWLYHFLPFSTFSLLLAVHAACLRAPPTVVWSQRVARAAALAILLLASAPLVIRTVRINWERAEGRTERRAEIQDLLTLLATQPDARTIEVLSSDITPVFPLARLAGLREHMSMPHLWLPMVEYRSIRDPRKPTAINPPDAMSAAERGAFNLVAADIRRGPDLLLVELPARNELRSGYPGGFDHLKYYRQDPGVAALLPEYQPVGSARGYELFARRSASGSGDR